MNEISENCSGKYFFFNLKKNKQNENVGHRDIRSYHRGNNFSVPLFFPGCSKFKDHFQIIQFKCDNCDFMCR